MIINKHDLITSTQDYYIDEHTRIHIQPKARTQFGCSCCRLTFRNENKSGAIDSLVRSCCRHFSPISSCALTRLGRRVEPKNLAQFDVSFFVCALSIYSLPLLPYCYLLAFFLVLLFRFLFRTYKYVCVFELRIYKERER